jgi:predicted metal-dependent peptidase
MSPKQAESVDQWISRFVREPVFVQKYPFYAAILAKLTPVADPSVERMAVSLSSELGRIYLHINVASFVSEPQYVLGVLLHEVHHLALGHLGNPSYADAEEADLMDVALEMSANEYIEEPLPRPIVWKNFAAFGLRAGQSTLERYAKLRAARQATDAVSSRKLREDSDGARVDDHRHLVHRKAGAGPRRNDGAEEHVRRIVGGAIEQLLEQGQDGLPSLLAGKRPGRILEELSGGLLAPEARVDWKHALSMFAASIRAPAHTWSRPNRRFPQLIGRVPGRAYTARNIPRPRLLVAVDTSLSMTTRELEEVARHLRLMSEHATLTVVECDAERVRVYPFTGAIADMAGRGGTDLRPPFEPAFLAQIRPDGIVYFTDGDGPVPAHAPHMAPRTLWVLTKRGKLKCAWGERTYLERTEPEKISRKRTPRSP